MMRRSKALVIFIACLLLTTIPIQGQEAAGEPITNADIPVVFRMGGGSLEIWREGDAAPTPLRGCNEEESSGALVVSPNGYWLVMNTSPRERESSEGRFYNIWLCNPSTEESTQLAGQRLAGTRQRADVMNSAPSWSPDASQVAWTEAIANSSHRLMVYDLAAQTTTVLVDDLPPTEWGSSVIWGTSGLLVIDDAMMLFDEAGNLITTLPAPDDYTTYFWVTHESGRELIGSLGFDTDVILLLDPATEEQLVAEGGVEEYSLLASDPSLGVRFILSPDSSFQWWVRTPEGAMIDTGHAQTYTPVFSNYVAISPEGDALVIGPDTAYFWRDGQAQVIRGTERRLREGALVRWAPTAYRALGELVPGGG
jgi:hypothetical protein